MAPKPNHPSPSLPAARPSPGKALPLKAQPPKAGARKSPRTTPASCPIRTDTERVVSLGADLTRALNQLRRDLRRCRTCESSPSCPVLESFNSMVNEAILAVNIEFGLI